MATTVESVVAQFGPDDIFVSASRDSLEKLACSLSFSHDPALSRFGQSIASGLNRKEEEMA